MHHGVAADLAEAAALALNAGVDIDMMSRAYLTGLPQALDRGLVTIATIDAAVARVLALKARLGLFDDPYRRCTGPDPETPARRAARRAAARDAATRSIVLLRNDGALPLPPDPGRIALIGPLADAPAEMLGPWAATGRGDEAIALLPALRAALPDTAIDPAPGVAIEGGTAAGIAAAMAAAERADHVLLALGEAAWMSGEAASRARIALPGHQEALAAAVLATGKPTTVLLFSGRPLALPDIFERAAAVLACWFPGSEAGGAIAALLTGAAAPSAALAVTWPRDPGQIPIAYAARPGGRPENPADKYTSKYLDLPNSPQFPFGHGLTYTTLHARPTPLSRSPTGSQSRPSSANTGARAGAATAFLFIRDPVASVARPVLELKRFQKVALDAGREPRRPLRTRPRRLRLPRRRPPPDRRARPVRDPCRLLRRPRSLRSAGLTLD